MWVYTTNDQLWNLPPGCFHINDSGCFWNVDGGSNQIALWIAPDGTEDVRELGATLRRCFAAGIRDAPDQIYDFGALSVQTIKDWGTANSDPFVNGRKFIK